MLEKTLTTDQLPIWAEEYARSVATTYQPDCIILFGSVARDAQQQGSDIDILVIGGELPTGPHERFRLLMRLPDFLLGNAQRVAQAPVVLSPAGNIPVIEL